MTGGTRSSMRLHHGLYEVHLPVTDVARAVDFYVEKLGFELGFGGRGDPSALLLFEDGSARWMLGLFQVERIVRRHPAEYHVSFRVAEFAYRPLSEWRALVAGDVGSAGPVDHGLRAPLLERRGGELAAGDRGLGPDPGGDPAPTWNR